MDLPPLPQSGRSSWLFWLGPILEESHVHCHRPVLHELHLHWEEEWAFIWLQEWAPPGKRHFEFPLLAGASAKLSEDPTVIVRGFAEPWAISDLCERRPP